MDKQALSKIPSGSLVMFTTSRARKYVYEQPGVLVGVGTVEVRSNRYPYKMVPKPGVKLYPVTGNGTDENPFVISDERVEVPNAGVRSLLATRSAIDGTVPDFLNGLREWKQAEEEAQRVKAKQTRLDLAAEVQARVDWVRSFGLTCRYDAHFSTKDLVESDGYGADVQITRSGQVLIDFDLLVGLVSGPAE